MRITLLCLFLCPLYTTAQSLDQWVIGSAGNFSSTTSNTTLSWTAGETLITTASSTTAILTQGFQQPIITNPLNTTVLSKELNVVVYPNPSAEQVTIQSNQSGNLYAELFDILGQKIGIYPLISNQTEIDLSDFPAANYLLRIQTKDNQAVQTFKIQKIQ